MMMMLNSQAVFEWKRGTDHVIVTWHSFEELLVRIRLCNDGWYDLHKEKSMRLKTKVLYNEGNSLDSLKCSLIAGERYDVEWGDRWTTLKCLVMGWFGNELLKCKGKWTWPVWKLPTGKSMNLLNKLFVLCVTIPTINDAPACLTSLSSFPQKVRPTNQCNWMRCSYNIHASTRHIQLVNMESQKFLTPKQFEAWPRRHQH